MRPPPTSLLFGKLPNLIGEDGLVNEEKVRAATEELIAARPGLAKGAGPGSELRGGPPGPISPDMSWSSVLRGE